MRDFTRSERRVIRGLRLVVLGLLVAILVAVFLGLEEAVPLDRWPLLVLPVVGAGVILEAFVLVVRASQTFRSSKDIARERRERRREEEEAGR